MFKLKTWLNLACYPILVILPLTSLGFYLIFNQSSGSSMGQFAYADAAGYKSCIESLALFGEFGSNEGFCYRRPVYPFVAGILLKLIGNPMQVQLIFSIVFSITILWLLIELRRHFAFFPIFVSTIFLNWQWHEYASVSFTTEGLGLISGAIATIYIFRAMRLGGIIEYFVAGFAIGFSQIVRPGNIFLLLIPLILANTQKSGNYHFPQRQLVVVSSFIPFALIKLLGHQLKVDALNSSGNFWGVLFGLSDGNKTWAEAYKIPGVSQSMTDSEIWDLVKDATIANLLAHPQEIFVNIFANIWKFVEYRLTFVSSSLQSPLLTLSYFEYFVGISLFIATMLHGICVASSKTRLFYIYVILSTTITFGVLYNAESFRTISSLHFLYVLVCSHLIYTSFASIRITLFSKYPKIYFTRKQFGSKTEENHMYAPWGQTLDLRLKYISGLSLIGFSLGILFTTIDIHKTFSQPIPICDKQSSIVLAESSIQVIALEDIEKPPNFLWSSVLSNLNRGTLVHGIYKDSHGVVRSLDAYLPYGTNEFSQRLREGGCVKISSDSTEKKELWIAGLKFAQIEPEG